MADVLTDDHTVQSIAQVADGAPEELHGKTPGSYDAIALRSTCVHVARSSVVSCGSVSCERASSKLPGVAAHDMHATYIGHRVNIIQPSRPEHAVPTVFTPPCRACPASILRDERHASGSLF